MVGYWGGVFHVKQDPHLSDAKGNRRVVALNILSELASAVQREERITIRVVKPRLWKRLLGRLTMPFNNQDDVKAQCIVTENSGIDLYLSPQEIEEDGSSVFQWVAFGYVHAGGDAAAGATVRDTWQQIQKVSEKVVANFCSSKIVWLTEEELDARVRLEGTRRSRR